MLDNLFIMIFSFI